MYRFLLLVITAGLLSPISLKAELNSEVHQICLQAADYEGCVEAQSDFNSSQSEQSINNHNQTIVKPNCELRRKDDSFEAFAQLYSCFICWDAYDRNIEGKDSILSGNSNHRDEWYQKSLDISLALQKGSGGQLIDPNRLVDIWIDISHKRSCPTLY